MTPTCPYCDARLPPELVTPAEGSRAAVWFCAACARTFPVEAIHERPKRPSELGRTCLP